VILYFLWRFGLLSRADGEKILYFLGLTNDPQYLSRRQPLVRRIDWLRALFVPAYARSVARWLAWRAELYDGRSG
jgi:hypothetical protein